MEKTHEIDMTTGSLLPKIIRFALPVMFSGFLQLLFNAADLIVVGRFAGDDALGQVGATGSLINLIVNLLIGLSIGANVTLARYFGAKNDKAINETVHTTMVLAVLGGLLIGVLGFTLAKPMLRLMKTPPEFLDGAALYMRIIFIGVPVTATYNYGAAILRAVGDTRRPLFFLMAAGVLNIPLNLFFVIVCHLSVAGVALATIISEALSMVLVVRCLMKSTGAYKLEIKKLRIYGDKLAQLIRIGIPAGLQGCVFSISNVVIQSAVNSFGTAAISGVTAANSIDGFMFCFVDSINQTATATVSQNMGAREYKRVSKTVLTCSLIVTVLSLFLAGVAILFRTPLVKIYASEKEVIEYAVYRILITCPLYFTCGLMNMMAGVNRGLGYSIMPTVVTLIGACAFRLVWIYTVFAASPTFLVLFISYPITWSLTAVVHYICYFLVKKRSFAKNEALYSATAV